MEKNLKIKYTIIQHSVSPPKQIKGLQGKLYSLVYLFPEYIKDAIYTITIMIFIKKTNAI